MSDGPERVTADEARKAVDVMDHRPHTPDERRTAFRYIDQTEAENARLREALVKIRRRTGELAIPKVIAAETMLGLWKIANDALEGSDE